jgi:hypothetical protein
MSMKPKASIPT